jgi:hypothetical protein
VFGTASLARALLPSLRVPVWPPYPCPHHTRWHRLDQEAAAATGKSLSALL